MALTVGMVSGTSSGGNMHRQRDSISSFHKAAAFSGPAGVKCLSAVAAEAVKWEVADVQSKKEPLLPVPFSDLSQYGLVTGRRESR